MIEVSRKVKSLLMLSLSTSVQNESMNIINDTRLTHTTLMFRHIQQMLVHMRHMFGHLGQPSTLIILIKNILHVFQPYVRRYIQIRV